MRNGERISNNVQASEKVYQSFLLETTNPGGHSSLPRADNAIYELSKAIVRIQEYAFPVVLNEVTRAYFERTADLVDDSTAGAIRAILSDGNDEAAFRNLSTTMGHSTGLIREQSPVW